MKNEVNYCTCTDSRFALENSVFQSKCQVCGKPSRDQLTKDSLRGRFSFEARQRYFSSDGLTFMVGTAIGRKMHRTVLEALGQPTEELSDEEAAEVMDEKIKQDYLESCLA